ncbi:anti-phage dCTP deaminase [Niabella drilacis]|uniref:Deoxycytidylate deaminase n=1 Tax=Niabella drilacis (strain DSM 25811 / CCM 8410 / CCUG 62505 / LMG 26954 / E90) TaxID=1285928 RepID=A0A1G7ABP5_NIADE|nr:anti-phage dCTP deaminase [Niabella drilacis]SDE11475.1 Deoxycytidylate deaminase [Niabella drilacis]
MSIPNPIPISKLSTEQKKESSTKEKVRNTLTDELIIGICAPIGSLREPVIKELSDQLITEYGYEVQILKLSSYIEKYVTETVTTRAGETKEYTFLTNKIDGGNFLRKEHGHSILSEMAINDIHITRHQDSDGKVEFRKSEELKSRKKCFIIDSLKNKAELELLRDIYKEIFYHVSIFSPVNERKQNLINKGLSIDESNNIIFTDNFENNQHGQNVKDTFIEADFFIRVSADNLCKLKEKINRYLGIIFESDVITPLPHEIAMYEAKSAAGNSACLSRQVGAAITNRKGEIISRGWNDVPKFGGNLYTEGDNNDHRCKHNGYCSNDTTKDIIAKEIVEAIFSDEIFKKKFFSEGRIDPLNEDYIRMNKIIRKNSRVKDLIEFSRAVHAEMHAIIIGSQLGGSKMIGGKLFCTTYPCHNCVRHIILSGIEEIYYIEPYSKSLGIPLHNDAITEDESDSSKVRLLVYDGVAPRRFMEFFIMKDSRKDSSGRLNLGFKNLQYPKSRISLQALPSLEQQATHSLYEKGLLKKNEEK